MVETLPKSWFLLENHHATSFDDLKAGLAYLKRKSSQRNEGPLAFVKANLTNLMDCQNTLDNMHSKLVEDQVGFPLQLSDYKSMFYFHLLCKINSIKK